jgi:hypothetical protein
MRNFPHKIQILFMSLCVCLSLIFHLLSFYFDLIFLFYSCCYCDRSRRCRRRRRRCCCCFFILVAFLLIIKCNKFET